MRNLKLLYLLVLAALSTVAPAQSIYVDFDIGSGTPEIGSGAPSSSFAGAAGIPGVWNRVFRDDNGPAPLFDTNGVLGGASMTWSGSAGNLGFNNPTNTGDLALLLNDAKNVSDTLTMRISGLAPGRYRVFTYAVEPQGHSWTTNIAIPGSVQGTVAVTGPMPGNLLLEGVTHSIHDLQFNGGELMIAASGEWPRSYVNGFQILAVPEPTTVPFLTSGLACLVFGRKRI
jgi:hypothetical protein